MKEERRREDDQQRLLLLYAIISYNAQTLTIKSNDECSFFFQISAGTQQDKCSERCIHILLNSKELMNDWPPLHTASALHDRQHRHRHPP